MAAHKEDKSDTQLVMSQACGRAFVARILHYTGVDRDDFHEDSRLHARYSGVRSVGIWLIDEIKAHCPELYQTMIKESEETIDERNTRSE